jgi:hypothetical protein
VAKMLVRHVCILAIPVSRLPEPEQFRSPPSSKLGLGERSRWPRRNIEDDVRRSFV